MKTQPLGGADGRRRFAVVLATGDKVKESVRAFANSLGATGHLHGIGAMQKATVAFWNPATRAYEHIEVNEQVEVLSLIGNVAHVRDRLDLHAHVVLGHRDGHTTGGHLIEAVVHPTLELLFVECVPALRREKDADTGLDLLAVK